MAERVISEKIALRHRGKAISKFKSLPLTGRVDGDERQFGAVRVG